MSEPWQIRVFDHQQLVHTATGFGPVELGRQSEGEARPYWAAQKAGRWRIVLARLDEDAVSRKHLRAEPLSDNRVRLTNLSRKLPLRFLDGSELGPAGSRETTLPVSLRIGQRAVTMEVVGATSVHLQSLLDSPLPPGAGSETGSLFGTFGGASDIPGEALVRWLQAAMDVLHSAASTLDFFDRAAGALVERVGLDSGWVLLLDREEWRVQARKTAPGLAAREGQPSRQVLTRVLQEKKTFWQVPAQAEDSLRGVSALVAAPILDRRGEVIGALYGDRSEAGSASASPIRRLEAMLVELLAGGVAAGLARLEQEQTALQGQRKLLRMERDLEIGREIQAGFLPAELPHVAGWEVAAHFRPAREVSGDFYDAFALPDDQLALVIADVCDKGVGAALYMTLLRSLLRAFAQQTPGRELFGLPPQDVSSAGGAGRRRATLLADLTALSTVEFTNNYVAVTHCQACMFASLFFGVLDAPTGTLTYVNAGHDAPVWIGAGGVKGRLSPTGPVVGMRPYVAYDINRVVLEPGDAVLAYTDGVTEARAAGGQFFTEKRLLTLLEKPTRPAAALLDEVVRCLHEHTGSAEPSDDVTMLAVRRLA